MRAAHEVPSVSDLRLFDSCVTLGRVVNSGVPVRLTADNVLAVMDKHDIAEALVHDVDARINYPRSAANRRLLKEVQGIERLHPVWVLEPPDSKDPKAAADLVSEMLASGVKVARLMMGVAPPLHWLWRNLCEALEEHRVPCMLDFGDPGDDMSGGGTRGIPDSHAVDALREICLAHPQLHMVLSHVSGGLVISYPTMRLIKRVPNLHIDITSVVNYWLRTATEVGPERVFFATGMPFFDPATFISNVQYCHELDEPAKKRICGGNLRELMGAVR